MLLSAKASPSLVKAALQTSGLLETVEHAALSWVLTKSVVSLLIIGKKMMSWGL